MIYLTGESHIGCLIEVAVTRTSLPENIKFGVMGTSGRLAADFFVACPDRIAPCDPTVRTRTEALLGRPDFPAGDEHLYGFSLGFHAFRVCETPVWRRFRPAALGAVTPEAPLSDAVVDAIILEDCRNQRAFYRALTDRGVPCFVIESPPLQRRLAVLKAGAPADVILHVFERYRALSRAFFTELGIDIVEFPPEARDDDGFLKAEYEIKYKEDIQHGNWAYGALMLNRVLDYLRTHHPERL